MSTVVVLLYSDGIACLAILVWSIPAPLGAVGQNAAGRGRGVVVTASDCSPGGPSLKVLAKSLSAKHTDQSAFARAFDAAVGLDTTFANAHSSIRIRAVMNLVSVRGCVTRPIEKPYWKH